MKKVITSALFILIQFTVIHSAYAKVSDYYFKKAILQDNDEFKYEEKIKKSDIKNIPYYVIGYSKRKKVYEKHYNSSNRLTFYAKYSYGDKRSLTKMEFYISQKLLKIKIKDPKLMKTKRGVYNKIKYLKIMGKKKQIYKLEEYHSNGQVHIVSIFNDYSGLLEETQIYDRKGLKTLAQYFRYYNKKRYLFREEKLDKNKDGKKGYWYRYYDYEGKETDKRFYPLVNPKTNAG